MRRIARVLFSPAGAVDQEQMESVRRQGKSTAAESAIRLNVYQSDESDSSEPTKRESTKRAEIDAEEVDPATIVKKWAKKSA